MSAPDRSSDAAVPAPGAATADADYAERLNRLQNKRWKKVLNVQAPYRANIRRMRLGRTLDVGCGNGRNLSYLPEGSVGVDHNAHLVAAARDRGGEAYTVAEFFADPDLCAPGMFNAILAAHLVEHLTPAEARDVLRPYLPSVRPGGRVVFITPQERGFASDPTHVEFTDHDALAALSADLELVPVRRYSFPFPRAAGKLFVYNEFNFIARIPTERVPTDPGTDRLRAHHVRSDHPGAAVTAQHDAPIPPDAAGTGPASSADGQLHDPDPEELLLDELVPEGTGAAPSSKRKMLALAMRIVGIGLALAAVTLCVIALVDAWPTVSEAVSHASPAWLVLAMVASALSMTGLAVLWHQVLLAFDRRWPLGKVTAWYFAGELGKYLPGGIWPVVGRGELARRGGVARSTAYATTLLSLALMCVGAAIACGLLAPFLALNGGGIGLAWLLLLLIPLGVVFAHPVVSGPFFRGLAKLTKGRVALTPPSFGRMLGLLITGTPTWLLVGAASCAITEALGYDQQPARVAFAAIVAWIVGFLAVPVPAGAGIRELLFVALCGLDAGPAVAVAAIARLMLMVTDGVGGVAGLLVARRAGNVAHAPAAEQETIARNSAGVGDIAATREAAPGAADGAGNTA